MAQYQRLFRWTDEATKYLKENGFYQERGITTWIRKNSNGRYTLAYKQGDAWCCTEIKYIYDVRGVI